MVESRILGEMLAHLARDAGATVTHREGLGGTLVVWRALLKGDIDAYVEYTGTISAEILTGKGAGGEEAMRQALAEQGIAMSRPLGFNNTYAIGMRKETAERLGIQKISDLRQHPDLRFGFSNEFRNRADGWPGLQTRYGLPQTDVKSLDHELAYRGVAGGSLDATDVYSTDAAIRQYQLKVLEDDLHYFPSYQAVILYRADLKTRAPGVVKALLRLEGRVVTRLEPSIDEETMATLNARVQIGGENQSAVAADFLNHMPKPADQAGTPGENILAAPATAFVESRSSRLVSLTWQHLALVSVSLAVAILVAVPLGIVAARRPAFGQLMLGMVGIVQTVPSLALLILLTPFLGLGATSAVAALFLYSLLPIVRNTVTGLRDIPLSLRESAEALGLSPAARLRLIEMPMASPTILAGIKTAAIINVGTATLAGLIGAGGYGQLIWEGYARGEGGNDLMVQGAAAAAVMALAVQALFELGERFVVPRGLRLRAE
jgi:osmoprotectant transport system permease protein